MDKEISETYLRQIQKYPLLTLEDEIELSKKIKEGDEIALNKLVNSNLRLVVSIACKFNPQGFSLMDVIQEGNMGLISAAKKYSAEFNTRFSTYAYPWILQYMLRFVNNSSNMISLPHRKDELLKKILSAQNYFFQHNGREASYTEIALYIGIPVEKVKEVMNYSYTMASLDAEVSSTSTSPTTFGELLADTKMTPEEQFMYNDCRDEIVSLMNMLPGNEKKVLWYRFNFNYDEKAKTLREISSLIGISPEAVRQTELRALRHMRYKVSELDAM